MRPIPFVKCVMDNVLAMDSPTSQLHSVTEIFLALLLCRFLGRGLLTIPDYKSWKPRRSLYDSTFKRR